MTGKQYITPEVTVVSFRNEQGYAFSTLRIDDTAEQLERLTMQLMLENELSTGSTDEQFDYQSGWSNTDGNGFWTNGSSGGYF